jgi:hypothetical protein
LVDSLQDNHIAVPSATPHRAIVAAMDIGSKPMEPGFTPHVQKRSFGMLPSDTSTRAKRFQDDAKRLKQEPGRGVQVLVPNVCLSNKQDETSKDCDNDVRVGFNPDDDSDHWQQQHEHDEEEEENGDDDDHSDSDSSSDDCSSGSESRTRSIETGKDWSAAPAPTSRPCKDDDQQEPVKKEAPPVKKEPHCDGEPPKDEMGATAREQIHRLELEAYAALMKAFHASGNPLSWEKEGLLSDLRVHLHISNDEHLKAINVILNRKGRTR